MYKYIIIEQVPTSSNSISQKHCYIDLNIEALINFPILFG